MLDDLGEVALENGCLKLGDVDLQVAELLLVASSGEFKESPMLGGNIRELQGGIADPFWKNRVRNMLRSEFVEADVNLKYESVEIIINE